MYVSTRQTHLKKHLLPSLIISFWSLPASAIVNVEDMRVGAPEEGFSGNIDLGINGKRGNTDKDDLNLGSRLQWHRDMRTDFIVLSYSYGENNNVRNTNKAFLHGRHVHHYQPRRAWEAFAQVEENEFARLSYRGLIGGGMRFTLMEEDKRVALYLGVGAFHARETLDRRPGLTDQGSDSYERANLYISYKHQLNGQLRLVSTTYYQPRLDDTADFRALEQAGMTIKMTETLSFKLSLNITHDSRPPQTVRQTDVAYATGLHYQF